MCMYHTLSFVLLHVMLYMCVFMCIITLNLVNVNIPSHHIVPYMIILVCIIYLIGITLFFFITSH